MVAAGQQAGESEHDALRSTAELLGLEWMELDKLILPSRELCSLYRKTSQRTICCCLWLRSRAEWYEWRCHTFSGYFRF